jgi:hypothetical protein
MREEILARGEDPALFPILNSRPELFSDLLWIWEGFMVLSSLRQVGMSGPQPLAMSDILSYAKYERIDDPEERVEFLHHVQKLDLVFRADWRARNPTTPGKGSPGKGLGRP